MQYSTVYETQAIVFYSDKSSLMSSISTVLYFFFFFPCLITVVELFVLLQDPCKKKKKKNKKKYSTRYCNVYFYDIIHTKKFSRLWYNVPYLMV